MAGVNPSKYVNYISEFKKILVTRQNGVISQKFKIDSATNDKYYFSIVNSNSQLVSLEGRTFIIYGSIFDAKDALRVLFYSDNCVIQPNNTEMCFTIETYTSQYMNIVKTNKIIDITIVEVVVPAQGEQGQDITQVVLRDSAIAYKRPYIDNVQPTEIVYRNILTGSVPFVNAFGAGEDINLIANTPNFAFGTGLETNNTNQVVLGQYNQPDATKIIVIGNGTNDSQRSNLFSIDYDGNVLTSGSISANAIYVGGQDLNNVVDQQLASTSAWVNETFETQTDAIAAHNSLAQEIEGVDQKIDAVSAAVSSVTIPTNISYFNNDVGYLVPSSLNGYATQIWVNQQGFAYSNQLNAYALKSEVPTKTSDLTNDSGFITGYQAGTGIAINNGVISIDGELGKTYYADDTTLELSNSNVFSVKSIFSKLAAGSGIIITQRSDGVAVIRATNSGGGGGGTSLQYYAGTGLLLGAEGEEGQIETTFSVNTSWLNQQIEAATQDLQNLSAGTGLKIEDNIISISATYVVPSTLNDYATTATVQGIDERVSAIENAEYISSGDVDTKISVATTDMATTGWVKDQHYITSAEAPSTVYYAGEGLSLEDSTFILTATLSTMTNDAGFATTGYVNDQIDAIDYSAYATNTDLQAVSSEVSANTESINSITNAMNQKQDKAEMSAYALSASVYNKDEVDNISTALYNQITGATEGAASEQWVEDHFLSSLTSADIPSEFIDTTELASALEPYALSTDVTTAIETATSGKADKSYVDETFLSASQIADYYTSAQVETRITAETSGKVNKSDFDTVTGALSTAIDSKTTSGEVKEQIEAYGYQNATDVANAISGKADTATVNGQFVATSTWVNTTFETIDNVNALTNRVKAIEDDYATSGYVTSQVNALATGAVQTNTNNISQLSTDLGIVSGKANTNETNIGLISSDLDTLSGELDTTSTFISGKVSTLSGQLTTASSTLTSQTFYLSGQLSTAQDDISTISSDLEDAVELVGSLSTTVDDLSSTVLTFDDRITTISSNCDFVSGQVDIISGKVDDNTENIEAVSGIATTNATNIGIISGNLNTVSGNLNTVSTNLNIVSGKVDIISSDYVTSGVLTAYVNNQYVAVSQLANDVGYITAEDLPEGTVYLAGEGLKLQNAVFSLTGSVLSGDGSTIAINNNVISVIGGGSGGKTYTGGTGIEVDNTNNTISLTATIPTAISDLTDDVGYLTAITVEVENSGSSEFTGVYFDSSFVLDSQLIRLNTSKIIEDGQIATTGWVYEQGYLTSITSSNITTALGFTPVSSDTTYTAGTGLALSGTEFRLTAEIPTGLNSWASGDNKDYISGLGFITGVNLDGYATQDWVTLTALADYAKTSAIPTSVSELQNDVGYITGITSTQVTDALGFTPVSTDTTYTAGTGIDITNNVISLDATIPTKTSDLTNDSGYITGCNVYIYDSSEQTIAEMDLNGMSFDDNHFKQSESQICLEVGNIFDDMVDAGCLNNYAQLSDIKIYTGGTNIEVTTGNVINFTGTIPSINGLISASQASAIASAVTTGYLTDYYTKSEANAAFLTATTVIPTAVSDLTNDADYQTGTQVSAIAQAYASEATPSVDTICGMLSSANENLTISKTDNKILFTATGGGGSTNLIAGNRIRLTQVGNPPSTRIDVLDYAISAANTASINVDWRNCSTTTEVGTIAYNYEGIRPVTVSFNSALPNGVSATVDSATSSVVFTALSASDVTNGTSVVSATIIADDAQEAVVQTTINTIGYASATITATSAEFVFDGGVVGDVVSAFNYYYDGSEQLTVQISGELPAGISAVNSYDSATGSGTVTFTGNAENYTIAVATSVNVVFSANDIALNTNEQISIILQNVETPVTLDTPLTIKALEPMTIKAFDVINANLMYSINGGSWNNVVKDDVYSIPQDGIISLSCAQTGYTHPGLLSTANRCEIYGNIQSLWNWDNNSAGNMGSMFRFMPKVTNASKLLFPATTIRNNNVSWQSMFSGCTLLSSGPKVLSLTAPGGNLLYNAMFNSCTSLTDGPEIMLSAITPVMYDMFYGCTSLSSIKVHFTAWVGSNSNSWLQNVAANGEFHCPAALGTNDTIERGANRCPNNWTVINDVQ